MLEFVDFVSTNRLESLEGDSSWSVISITDPGTSIARVSPKFGALLRLSFDDLDQDALQAGCAGQQIGLREFQQLMVWLEGRHSDPDTRGVLIQCEAGRSRSAAFAIFISGLYGAQFVERRRIDGFNRLLLSILETVTRRSVGRPGNWMVTRGEVIGRL